MDASGRDSEGTSNPLILTLGNFNTFCIQQLDLGLNDQIPTETNLHVLH